MSILHALIVHFCGQPSWRDEGSSGTLSVQSVSAGYKPGSLYAYFVVVGYSTCHILDGGRHFGLRGPMSNA